MCSLVSLSIKSTAYARSLPRQNADEILREFAVGTVMPCSLCLRQALRWVHLVAQPFFLFH